jgi:hypothetical protein
MKIGRAQADAEFEMRALTRMASIRRRRCRISRASGCFLEGHLLSGRTPAPTSHSRNESVGRNTGLDRPLSTGASLSIVLPVPPTWAVRYGSTRVI